MGFLLFLPLLTFIGLKVSHYVFLAVVRGFWQLLCSISTCFLVDRTSSAAAKMAPITRSSSTGSSSPSASQSLLQFLNSVLSMRGPNSLPYDEDTKWVIRQNLLAVIKEFAGLQVKSGTFTHNDGRATNLLQVVGTIPMFYKDVGYNIPVVMWLPEAYPRVCPLIFVSPTQDMVIKSHHRYVDASGNVTSAVPYLQRWMYPRSNLVELVRSLSLLFGEDPPLYSRSAQSPARVQPKNPGSSRVSSMHARNPIYGSPTSGSGSSRPQSPDTSTYVAHQRLSHPPPYTASPLSSPRPVPQTKIADPVGTFKMKAINALTERMHRDSNTILRRGDMEMDELFNTQMELNRREEYLYEGLRDLKLEKELLEEQLQLCMTNSNEIELWLRNNDGSRSDIDIDLVFAPCDALSDQLLENTAADLAIEDTLYSLDKAVQDGSVPWDSYYKSVRMLSREQFYVRATCAKVRAAQMNYRFEAMAARTALLTAS